VLRIVALGSLPGPWLMFTGAVAAHTMGRVAAVAMAGTMELATHSGLGADYGRGTTRTRAAASTLAGIAITALAVGWWAAPLAGAAVVAVLATGTLARRKIGGISGDVLGATEQVAECLCLVVLTGLAR
jgi:adenosylcobinamide-GDP ribazoletransferase